MQQRKQESTLTGHRFMELKEALKTQPRVEAKNQVEYLMLCGYREHMELRGVSPLAEIVKTYEANP